MFSNRLKQITPVIGIAELREAIPEYCFRPSYRKSLWYLFRDLALAIILMRVAYVSIPLLEAGVLRYVAWASYGYLQGLVCTGLWVRKLSLGTKLLCETDKPPNIL